MSPNRERPNFSKLAEADIQRHDEEVNRLRKASCERISNIEKEFKKPDKSEGWSLSNRLALAGLIVAILSLLCAIPLFIRWLE
jgi:hypothetical protein